MFPLRTLALLVSAGVLAGCTVGPDYHRPDSPLPQQYQTSIGSQQATRPANFALWWQGFDDPLIKGWPRLTVWPVSTSRSRILPETRKPRSLCTRAITTPVNARAESVPLVTAATLTNGGWVRGSLTPDASPHATKARGSRQTAIVAVFSRSMGSLTDQKG